MYFERVNRGETVQIRSYKHDGSLHRTWDKTTVLYCDDNHMIGGNYRTLVTEKTGEKWRTKGSAIVYFSAHHWFNVVALITKVGVEYYCNLASPASLKNKMLDYVDYDLDIVVRADGTLQILDGDEFEQHEEAMGYPASLISLVEVATEELLQWIKEQRELFAPQKLVEWMAQFESLKKKDDGC